MWTVRRKDCCGHREWTVNETDLWDRSFTHCALIAIDSSNLDGNVYSVLDGLTDKAIHIFGASIRAISLGTPNNSVRIYLKREASNSTNGSMFRTTTSGWSANSLCVFSPVILSEGIVGYDVQSTNEDDLYIYSSTDISSSGAEFELVIHYMTYSTVQW